MHPLLLNTLPDARRAIQVDIHVARQLPRRTGSRVFISLNLQGCKSVPVFLADETSEEAPEEDLQL